jgi:hypothetical protein
MANKKDDTHTSRRKYSDGLSSFSSAKDRDLWLLFFLCAFFSKVSPVSDTLLSCIYGTVSGIAI